MGGGGIAIDGLLGIGGKGAPGGELEKLVEEMRELREKNGWLIAAVDVPSGMDADTGEAGDGCVVADRSFMIGAVKMGLLSGNAANHAGALELVGVDGLSARSVEGEGAVMICPQEMDFGKRPRDFDFHKGKAGRVAIIAGSAEYSGAAITCVIGALQGGGGLVTLHARGEAFEAVRSRMPCEAMVRICERPDVLLQQRCDAIVIGPGLGEVDGGYAESLIKLIDEAAVPVIIDADGLNLMARLGRKAGKGRILTPHPGEFGRLAPELEGLEREEAAVRFVEDSESILLLKGARTLVAKNGEKLRVNSTGTPAMSNGGQGDLLSGVIGALTGGGMASFEAASLGAWMCGRAAEICEAEWASPALAGEVAKYLGRAMEDWRRGDR